MSSLIEIETAIARLPLLEAQELQEWLQQWLEDQCEMTPEFLTSIERGKADLVEGYQRVVLHHP